MSSSTRRPRSGDRQRLARQIGAALLALSSTRCSVADPAGEDAGATPPALCHAPASVSGSPRTIDDVTALINALREQHGGTVDLPCFVASLARPLGATASAGFVSAQAASGARSPRMFLWSGALVMSVVPEGLGRNLLEIGVETAPTRSIKAEISFPVTAQLSTSTPYDRVRDQARTRCGSCHADEKLATGDPGISAFESEVLRPSDYDLVDIASVALESKGCDPAVEAPRCALLGAVFDQGGIHPQAFSREARTLYGD